MEFLGIGPLELLFVLLIALLVIGPKDMAKSARTLGRHLNSLYKSDTWNTVMDASQTIRTLPERLAREAALEDLDQTRDLLNQTTADINEAARESTAGLEAWTKPSGSGESSETPDAKSDPAENPDQVEEKSPSDAGDDG